MDFLIKENPAIREKYFYKTHKSGLPIYVIPKKHSTAFAMFATRYGSIDATFRTQDDKDFITVPDGIAHFLEHKLFEEADGSDAFTRFSQYGGNANAFTSFTRTGYIVSCTNNFDENLEVLLDFVTHPYFNEKSVAKEQGIIGEEIKMYEDNPGWRVYFNMLTALYHENPVRIDIAGTIDSIAKITPDYLYKCYNTFYNLHNMALCVCGDVTPEQVEAVCDKILQTAPEIAIARSYPDEPETIAQERITLELEVAQPMFSIAIKDKPVKDGTEGMKREALNEIILQLLFGRSSDFYSRHYESGLINAKFGFDYDHTPHYAFVSVSGSCENPDAVREAIGEEIATRKENFFTREEFDRARRAVYAGCLHEFESTSDISSGFLAVLFSGGDLLDYPNVVAAADYDEAKKLFNEIYDMSKSVISIVFPKKIELKS